MTRFISKLAAVAAIAIAMTSQALAAGLPKTGDSAPAVVGTTLGGEPFDLASLRGHVVVVNIWATWCPPCRAEMPALDAFYKRHKGAGLALVGLSVDRPRDEDDVREVMRAFSYPVVILRGAKVNSLGVPTALPITIVVDRVGVVREVIVPDAVAPMTTDRLTAAIAPILAETASR